ncbi:hypothetical protein SDC9_156098 [bioreactor metagenome]|uniref:Uncharacterized protein n=1 Tax=bioreactor metagenome TaxID=1076179 RepID=A0A645F8L3_9ZZZZ
MSYYHPDCAGRIQLIRSLQKDHYYPLGVIKRMLQSAAPNQMAAASIAPRENDIGRVKCGIACPLTGLRLFVGFRGALRHRLRGLT